MLITGANAGIGFGTAVAIAKLNPKLYVGMLLLSVLGVRCKL